MSVDPAVTQAAVDAFCESAPHLCPSQPAELWFGVDDGCGRGEIAPAMTGEGEPPKWHLRVTAPENPEDGSYVGLCSRGVDLRPANQTWNRTGGSGCQYFERPRGPSFGHRTSCHFSDGPQFELVYDQRAHAWMLGAEVADLPSPTRIFTTRHACTRWWRARNPKGLLCKIGKDETEGLAECAR